MTLDASLNAFFLELPKGTPYRKIIEQNYKFILIHITPHRETGAGSKAAKDTSKSNPKTR